MRWECLRGSRLFVVWDMSQVNYSRPGRFSVLRDLGGAFGGDATNLLDESLITRRLTPALDGLRETKCATASSARLTLVRFRR
jgi:hypothetical protein